METTECRQPRCGKPVTWTCDNCGRAYCKRHTGKACRHCHHSVDRIAKPTLPPLRPLPEGACGLENVDYLDGYIHRCTQIGPHKVHTDFHETGACGKPLCAGRGWITEFVPPRAPEPTLEPQLLLGFLTDITA